MSQDLPTSPPDMAAILRAIAERDQKPKPEKKKYPRKMRGIQAGARGPYTTWGREAVERLAEPPKPSLDEHIEKLARTDQEKLLQEVEAAAAFMCFAEFFKQAWRVLEPNTDLIWNWHLDLMCNVVQAIFEDWLKTKSDKDYINRCRNVVFNVPPGSSKSATLARSFQAWAWLHWPGMKFICLSVNDDATMRDARATRDLVRSPWYMKAFGIKWSIKADQDATSSFGNTEGGDRISLPIKSEIVGLRSDCILIDDPNNPKKAESKKERDEVNDLWTTNQYNRVNDMQRSLRFGVQQRTHAADWTGNVIELQGTWSPDNLDGWLHVVLPAEFEPERKFIIPAPIADLLREQHQKWYGDSPDAPPLVLEDPRAKVGDSIDPKRMPPSVLAAERKRFSGTGNYAGQMQQRPTLAEGAMIQRPWFNWCRLAGGVRHDIDELDTGRPRPALCHAGTAIVVHAAPLEPERWDFDWVGVSLDCASKKTEKGSNYGILVVAGKGGRRFVLDDHTRRGSLPEIIDVVKEIVRLWHPDFILVEAKAAGPDVMDTLREQMAQGDCPMVTIEESEPGNSDKEMRMEAASPYLKNGMVHLLDGAPWLEEFVHELSMFPHGLHDDRVDALSQILNHVRAAADEWPAM